MSSAQKGKKRGLKSCLRCHRRKQRCIGYPTCESCSLVSEQCIRDSNYSARRLAGLSKEKLLDRIERLEAGEKLEDVEILLNDNDNDDRESDASPAEADVNVIRHEQSAEVHGAATSNNEAILMTTSDSQADGLPATRSTTHENHSSLDYAAEFSMHWPNARVGALLVKTYLETVHMRVPFFDHTDLLEIHTASTNEITRSNLSAYQSYKILMVYAIGGTISRMKRTDVAVHPQDYFQMAKALEAASSFNIIEQMESLMFNVMFRLRSSLESKVWFEVGLALRTAVAAGLHREQYYQALDPVTADWRRRLFWCIYIMERNVCFSMKRPVSLADHDIDAGTPSVNAQPSPNRLAGSKLSDGADTVDLDTSTAILALTKIKSDLHTTLNRCDRAGPVTSEHINPLLEQVQVFEYSIRGYNNQDFLQLHVNNAIRSLIEPILTTIDKDDKLLRTCLQAAGRSCQLFKKLQQTQSLGFGFTMANSVFVAGLTICYILFKNPSFWKPSTSNDLSAGSSILSLMSERNPNMKKYSDVLEATINGVTAYADTCLDPYNEESQTMHSLPPAFDKLGETFKALGFELPPEAYPNYTTSPVANSTSPVVFSTAGGHAGQSSWLSHDSMGQTASNFPFPLDVHSDDLWSSAQDNRHLVGYEEMPFISNEYTQQMMTEILGPYFPHHNAG